MKKLLILVMLCAVVSGGAFAQLVWNGEFYTGLEFSSPHGSDEYITQNHTDHHETKGPTQFDLTGTYTGGIFGVKLDTLFQDVAGNEVSLVGAYGWVNFLDDQVRLSLGKISDGVWVTSLEKEHVLDKNIRGFRVEFKPRFLGGLNLGAAFPAGDSGDTSYDGEEFANGMILGASYIHPLFNTVAAYDRGGVGRVIFGFNYTGIYELTDAGIEIDYRDLTDTWDSGGSVTIDEKIGYRIMRPLTVSLHASQTVYGDSDTDINLLFNPEVSYRLTPSLTAGLEAELQSPDYFTTINLDLVPYVDYALSGGAYIYLQYRLHMADMKNPDHSVGLGLTLISF
ncbi:MAG: hypothetical protein LBI85_08885 [Spirochaetaceae bacterium]|jgi:hypothetical protein|nr:hypothetical protein [Spirochaetaceae bacterium]